MAESPTPTEQAPLDKATIDKWWERLLKEPVYVCLLLSLLYSYKQDRRLDERDETHRKEIREMRQEVNTERASAKISDHERDVAQQKLLEAQRREIDALNQDGQKSQR